MKSRDAKLSAEYLTAGYDRRLVLDDVHIRVGKGEMVGIIGPNGSGKSTLLRVIGRLLRPSSGHVYLDGRSMGDLNVRTIAQSMAILPQAPPATQELTVRELVGYGRYPHIPWLQRLGIRDREVIESAITACGMGDLADRMLNTLSGGERQRAWIAMAVAQQPRALLLDEPVTFLDISHQLEVMDLISDLNRVQGITVIVVLHDLNLASRYCARLIAIKEGRVHSDDLTEAVIQPKVLREVFGIDAHVGKDPVTKRPVFYPCRIALTENNLKGVSNVRRNQSYQGQEGLGTRA